MIDERGVIIKEGKTNSEPATITRFVRHKGRKIEHVDLETGSLSQWFHAGLSREGRSGACGSPAGHVRPRRHSGSSRVEHAAPLASLKWEPAAI